MLPDEAELLGSAVEGDRCALERLLIRYQSRLIARIRRRFPPDLKTVISPEDILQDTYIDIFRGIRSFESTGSNAFYRWLLAVAENRLVDNVRTYRAAKRGGGRVRIAATAGSSVAPLMEILQPNSHTPSRSVAVHEIESAVWIALAALKPEYREALQLRFFKGLSVAEVAERMKRSEWSVHKLCSRGLQRMRESLGEASKFLSRK